jgi:hypothetical protein
MSESKCAAHRHGVSLPDSGSMNVITADRRRTELFATSAAHTTRARARGQQHLADDISARLSFVNESNDGYQDNKTGHNGDVVDYTSVRGKLKFELSDNANLVLTAQNFQNSGNQSQRRRERWWLAVCRRRSEP